GADGDRRHDRMRDRRRAGHGVPPARSSRRDPRRRRPGGAHAVYVGDAAPLPIDDVIVAHSVMRSAGPEATYRLHSVRRSVVASTTLSNPLKHNWRVHGDSERNYIGDSILVGSGAMLGWIAGDSLDRVFFVRNTVHYDATNGLFLAEPSRVRRLTVTDNVIYSDDPFTPG